MPKILCILGMVVALLLLVLFGLDMSMKMPFRGVSQVADIGFIVCALVLGYLSWSTWREQG